LYTETQKISSGNTIIMVLTNQEKQFYNRHLILNEIGESGQKALKASKILLIGAGGLGCASLPYLVASGIGKIGIIDPDNIATSNLHRQILYTLEDVGKLKVEIAAKKMRQLNPYIEIKTYPFHLTPDNACSIFEQYDIIIDGSDNFATRYLSNDAAILTNKPLVSGAIFKFQGQLSVFNYKGSGSYRCLYPSPPEQGKMPNCSQIGVLGVLPGIIGTMQAAEVIKIALDKKEGVLAGKLLCLDILTMQQTIFSYTKNIENFTKKELNSSFYASFEKQCQHPFNNHQNQMAVESLQIEEYRLNTEKYHLLDVRSYEEFENYNIGGQHINLQELDDRMGEIPNTKPLVVCCASGIRSKKAIEILTKSGYPSDNIYNLDGGLQ